MHVKKAGAGLDVITLKSCNWVLLAHLVSILAGDARGRKQWKSLLPVRFLREGRRL